MILSPYVDQRLVSIWKLVVGLILAVVFLIPKVIVGVLARTALALQVGRAGWVRNRKVNVSVALRT